MFQSQYGRYLSNHTYTINGYIYKTDAQGRVVSVEGQLSLKTQKNPSTRHQTAQCAHAKQDGSRVSTSLERKPRIRQTPQ
ncbi:MAG: DNA/RNA non-specific endonuclease [Pelistega sp.]|nr:DNA/RNA non-specific endonuclease [Pelistega sp.]